MPKLFSFSFNLDIINERYDLKATPLCNGFVSLNFKALSFGNLDKETFLYTWAINQHVVWYSFKSSVQW